MSLKLGRRSFLSSLGVAGAGMLGAGKLSALAPVASKSSKSMGSLSSVGLPLVDGHPIVPITSGLGSTGNPWAELGVQPLVNIQGTVTVIGGSVMKPEVMELMRMGNMHFVSIDELEAAAGKWLAKLCKSPDGHTGLVVNGAAAAAVVGYSGMMTEDYNERLNNIPDLTNFPKTEIIIQQSHRGSFDHQIRQTGAKLVVVNGRDEMIAAINPRTVGIHFLNIQSGGGVSGPETVAIAKEHKVYTFCDASADVPPKERLWEYQAVGFDMITFSGGKDICGPQAAGLLFGREDLIKWSLLNMSPQENRIGRASKVGKESIFALLKAVELFVNQDYNETLRKYDAKAQTITDALAPYGVTANARRFYMDCSGQAAPLGNVSPSYSWTWDADKVAITNQVIMQKLGETKPVAIGAGARANAGGLSGRPDPNWPASAAGAGGRGGGGRGAGGAGGRGGAAGAAGAGARGGAAAGAPAGPVNPCAAGGGGGRGGATPNSFGFSTWLLKDGEDKYIANRLVEIFNEAGIKKVGAAKVPAKAAPKKA
jgi:seryl-tRNA(Sec) selenium transferase